MSGQTNSRRAPFGRMACAAALAIFTMVGAAHAIPPTDPDEAKCLKMRYDAAAAYDQCARKVWAKWFAGILGSDPGIKYWPAHTKCRAKYTGMWARMQVKMSGSGSVCDNARYEDTGDGTVTDRLTGLQWEQKTDDATIHDKDDSYSLSVSPPFVARDGPAFSVFLATLNGSPCFAGHCDWRLPTAIELETIVLEPYPCTTTPCIDQDVFGPMSTVLYSFWSATPYADPAIPGVGVGVIFSTGNTFSALGDRSYVLRAVRGGM